MFVPWRRLLVAALLASAAFEIPAQSPPFPKSNARPPDGGDPRSRRPDPPNYNKYEYGKEIYAVKLGCDTCPLAGKELDESTAKKIIADETFRYSLSAKEDEALTTYLRERFGLLL